MNGPARQGTGPSRETLFITRRGGTEGLYVIKRDISCFFSSFSFIFVADVRPRGHAFARSTSETSLRRALYREMSSREKIESAGRSHDPRWWKEIYLLSSFSFLDWGKQISAERKLSFADDAPGAKRLIIYR